jgi:hypothetical protein
VGVIAVVGFALGIVWPKVAGLELGPAPPGDKSAVSAPLAKTGAAPAPSALAARPADGEAVTVGVGEPVIAKCRSGKAEARSCDRVAFDEVLAPPLRQLAACPAARGHEGKLSVGFEVDFGKAQLRVQRGKSSTLPAEPAEGVMKCLEANLASVSLAKLRHDHARYTVFFSLQFAPAKAAAGAAGAKGAAEAPAAKGSAGATPADAPPAPAGDGATARAPQAMNVRPNEGEPAEVRRGPYVVRDAPSRSGETVGRIAVGGKVTVVEHKGDWYRVRFGPDDKEGWVFREALGR